LALAERVVPIAVDSLAAVRAPTMALAYETLSHLQILVSFVATLSKSNAGQLVQDV
jgi:hypothetical protein